MSVEKYLQIEGITYSYAVTNILKTTIGYCKANSYKILLPQDVLIGMTLKGLRSKAFLDTFGINVYTLKDIFMSRKRKKGELEDIQVCVIDAISDSSQNGKVDEFALLNSILNIQHIKERMEKYFYSTYLGEGTVDEMCKQLMQRINRDVKEDCYTSLMREEKIKYCTDMTYKAYKGEYQCVIGRDEEIKRIEEVLQKNKKKNPMLVGDSGVGKTCIIEELCSRIVKGKIPTLENKRVMALNQFEIIAGSKYRGDLEERVKKVLDEITSRDDIIIFVDEIQYLCDLGKNEGSPSVLDIMKTYLSSDRLSVIGVTTFEDYRKHMEKDPSIERRFTKIVIEEPSIEETENIICGLVPYYEEQYGISIYDDEIKYIIKMSERYIPYRCFPDKAVDVLEEVFAKQAIKLSTADDMEINIGRGVINEVISQISQVPISGIEKSEANKVVEFSNIFSSKVIGQKHAVDKVANLLKISKAGIGDPTKPVSFLFYGPTGVGKTMLAKVMAEELFGCSEMLVRFDMSEYSEKSSVTRFIGAAPGYVGYEESGKLVKEVKKHPYSILLFDEIEKADSEVFNVFLQILDDGRLTSSQGQVVDFKNTIIVMTSNIGFSNDISKSCGFNKDDGKKEYEVQCANGMKQLEKTFRPEFLNRIDEIILFEELGKDDVKEITRNLMEDFKKQVLINGIEISYDDEVIDYIAENGYDLKYGARPIKRFIEKNIKPKIADEIIKEGSKHIHVTVNENYIEVKTENMLCC